MRYHYQYELNLERYVVLDTFTIPYTTLCTTDRDDYARLITVSLNARESLARALGVKIDA